MQETAAPWIKAFHSRIQGVPVRRRVDGRGVVAARQRVAFAHAGAHIPVGLLGKDQPFAFRRGQTISPPVAMLDPRFRDPPLPESPRRSSPGSSLGICLFPGAAP
jgi:hypothetical protein